MKIRKAEEKDIPRIMELLGQVLQIHAEIRPDVFILGTTKYTDSELKELLEQEDKPIFVAAGEDDVCMGYAFCQLKEQPFSTNMVPFKALFIDDLCVDKQAQRDADAPCADGVNDHDYSGIAATPQDAAA